MAIKLSFGNRLMGPRALTFSNARGRQSLGKRKRWFVKKDSILLLQQAGRVPPRIRRKVENHQKLWEIEIAKRQKGWSRL